VKNYEYLFSHFSDEFSDRELESITPDDILSFLTKITDGNKQTTKRNRYSSGVNLHNRLKGQVLIIRLATAISAQILITIQGIIVDLKKI
jgi:hypothetical protein